MTPQEKNKLINITMLKKAFRDYIEKSNQCHPEIKTLFITVKTVEEQKVILDALCQKYLKLNHNNLNDFNINIIKQSIKEVFKHEC